MFTISGCFLQPSSRIVPHIRKMAETATTRLRGITDHVSIFIIRSEVASMRLSVSVLKKQVAALDEAWQEAKNSETFTVLIIKNVVFIVYSEADRFFNI